MCSVSASHRKQSAAGDQCVSMTKEPRERRGQRTRGCLPSSSFRFGDGDSDSQMSLTTPRLPRD